MRKYLLGIFLISFLVAGSNVFAQTLNTEPNITINANPADPNPGEEVTISLNSYETNLDLAFIKWAYGTQSKSGYGEKEFVITASNSAGGQNNINVEITLSTGEKLSKNISFVSSSYDITWEALDSYTPPFFMGKKLPAREGNMRAIVLTPSSGQTSYVWQRNGKALQNKSGGNKGFIDFKNTELEKKENIAVSIIKPGGENAKREISIPLTNPLVLFYEYSPAFGLNLGKTIKNNVNPSGDTVSVFAVPMSFNTNPKPVFTWNLSGENVSMQQIPNLISFLKPDESGIVELGINVLNTKSLYQEITSSLNLNF